MQSPLRVFVAEEEAGIRRLIEVNLLKDGHVLTMDDNGRDCLERLEGELPDVLIIDNMMPFYTGMELLPILRANPRTAELPIILEAGLTVQQVEEAKRLGADIVLVKPFCPDTLRRSVFEAYELRNAVPV